MYESKVDPSYEELEQKEESCVSFLKKLCDNAGISLKMIGDTVVLFDQASYEVKQAVLILKRKGGLYLNYKLGVKKENTQYESCRVSYVLPSGELIEGIAKGENYEEGKGQRLEICQRVSTKAEAESVAAARLRLHNKFSKTASFTIPGNPWIAAGNTVELWGWGGWSGKYMVYKITHSVGSGGYTTKLELRRCLT